MGHHKRSKPFGRATGRHTLVNKRLRYQRQHLISQEKRKRLSETFFACFTNKDSNLCTLTLRRTTEPATQNRDGYRVINLGSLNLFLIAITRHMTTCPKAALRVDGGQDSIKLVGATRHNGVACSLSAYCLGCAHRFTMDTSPVVEINGNKHFDSNVRAVWGEMATGGGCSKLTELFNTMGMPAVSQKLFTTIENSIGKQWERKANEEMYAAAAEERAHAIQVGSVHEGVPSISVVCDGGWSKRSHKHTYDALGGVGVIIGLHSKKLLHMGVRTKTCAQCTHAESKGVSPADHECFKNWHQSSQAMEADIILEGFNLCEQNYGLRYTRLIADGDSSTLKNLLQNGPPWCRHLEKLECANHSIKCLRGHLERLVDDKRQYKGRDRLSKTTRERICRYIRYAIKVRSLSENHNVAIGLLKKDIINSMDHAFGVHIRCPPDVCLVKKEEVHPEKTGSENEGKPRHHPDSDVLQTVDNSISAWVDATTGDGPETTEARGGRPGGAVNVVGERRQDVMAILNRLAGKADRLVGNFTTNLAENWMSLRGKFDGGKFVDRCKRGSWQARCHGAVLRKNLGTDWSAKLWEEVTNTPATAVFHVFGKRVAKARTATVKCVAKPSVRRRRWQRKQRRARQNSTVHAKAAYGEGVSVSDPDDVTPEELLRKTNEYYVVHPQFPFLGATPDGVVYENGQASGLVEVKNVLKDKPITLQEAAANSSFCLKLVDGELHLRTSHQYFFQCMGQLHLSDMPWLDFVVRTQNPYQLFVTRLTPDNGLWTRTMLPKLQRFYFKALLPELAAPRHGTVSGIREPGTSWNDGRVDTCYAPSTQLSQPAQGRQSRSRRSGPSVRFVGRRIRHEWMTSDNESEWYEGTVLRLLSGTDGQPGTEYEVSYDGEDDFHAVDHLLEDFQNGSLTFL